LFHVKRNLSWRPIVLTQDVGASACSIFAPRGEQVIAERPPWKPFHVKQAATPWESVSRETAWGGA